MELHNAFYLFFFNLCVPPITVLPAVACTCKPWHQNDNRTTSYRKENWTALKTKELVNLRFVYEKTFLLTINCNAKTLSTLGLDLSILPRAGFINGTPRKTKSSNLFVEWLRRLDKLSNSLLYKACLGKILKFREIYVVTARGILRRGSQRRSVKTSRTIVKPHRFQWNYHIKERRVSNMRFNKLCD